MDEKKTVRRVTAVGILGNIVLVLFKLYAGIAGKSEAMVSDAVHSLSDVFATFVAYIGVRVSKKAPDSEHPYGHDRFECLASMILGLILCGTGVGVGLTGVKTILAGNYDQLETPGLIALLAAAVSIVVKEAMFWYTRHYARKIGSSAFMADAWHHRSDALSSVGSFIGIGMAKLGFPFMDSVASIVICVLILKVAFDISRDAVSKMLDTSCGKDFEQRLREFIEGREGVERVDLLRTRQFGNKIYVDLEIAVRPDISLLDAHGIAERVHAAVEREFPNVKHIMIHVNPNEEEQG